MDSRIKLDPLAYVLLVAVLGVQLYSSFFGPSADDVIAESDRVYKGAVFDSSDNIMQQVFHQNEIDRELLKAVLKTCAK